jgi:hypothetical protein
MKLRDIFAASAVAITCVAAQDSPPTNPKADAGDELKGGDAYLARSVHAVAERIAAIVQVNRIPTVVAVRADEAARDAEAQVRAQRLLSPALAAARGRAWSDLGFGSGIEPQALLVAIERDVPGMTFDATRERLLVDPDRMLPDSGHGDPDVDADASILLATGVAPDEPIAGHYAAHALLDGRSPDGPVTTDALLARSALAEGSANLAALTLLFGGVGLEAEVVTGSLRPEEVMGGRLVPESIRTAPPVVASLLQFVYLDGFAQAAAIARKGGFGRLAQERRARLTTRDVVHLDRPPAPRAEVLEPSLAGSLALTVVDRDSLGEQGIVALVSLLTGKDNLGLIAGDGWVADALWRFEPGPGSPTKPGEGATIWLTRWASDDDAADFSYGLERCLQARFPGESLESVPAGSGRTLRRADRTYRIERTGNQVAFRVVTPGIDVKPTPSPKKKGPPPRPIPPKNLSN